MPSDMAMERPDARIVGDKTKDSPGATRDGNLVAVAQSLPQMQ